MSAMPRKRRLAVKASSVAMGQFRPYAMQHKTPVAVGTKRARSLNWLQSEAGLMQDLILQIDETLLHRTPGAYTVVPIR